MITAEQRLEIRDFIDKRDRKSGSREPEVRDKPEAGDKSDTQRRK